MARSVASQHAQDIPEQIRGLGDKIEGLARQSVSHPSDLDTIAAQLTVLTERMSAVANQRFEDSDGIQVQLDRLSAKIGTAIDVSSQAHAPLWSDFDKLEGRIAAAWRASWNATPRSASPSHRRETAERPVSRGSPERRCGPEARFCRAEIPSGEDGEPDATDHPGDP